MVHLIGAATAAIGGRLRKRSRVLVGGAMALGAVVGAAVLRRRRRTQVRLPDPGPLVSETAVSVRNAAKSSVMAAVREADEPDVDLLTATAEAAIGEAARAGVDLAAAAVGVVEGAGEVAHLLSDDDADVVARAGSAVVAAAGSRGRVAGERIRELLEPHGVLLS